MSEFFGEEELEQCREVLRRNYKAQLTEYVRQMADDEEKSPVGEEVGKAPVLIQGDLFDVKALERWHEEKAKAEHVRKNFEARQKLKLRNYETPKDDNERLFHYQYLYIKQNDVNAWGDLIELATKVCKRQVRAYMKKKKIFLDEIAQDERANIAVEYVLRRYVKNIGYSITTNFIVALEKGVKHSMEYYTKLDKNTYLLDDLKGVTL